MRLIQSRWEGWAAFWGLKRSLQLRQSRRIWGRGGSGGGALYLTPASTLLFLLGQCLFQAHDIRVQLGLKATQFRDQTGLSPGNDVTVGIAELFLQDETARSLTSTEGDFDFSARLFGDWQPFGQKKNIYRKVIVDNEMQHHMHISHTQIE